MNDIRKQSEVSEEVSEGKKEVSAEAGSEVVAELTEVQRVELLRVWPSLEIDGYMVLDQEGARFKLARELQRMGEGLNDVWLVLKRSELFVMTGDSKLSTSKGTGHPLYEKHGVEKVKGRLFVEVVKIEGKSVSLKLMFQIDEGFLRQGMPEMIPVDMRVGKNKSAEEVLLPDGYWEGLMDRDNQAAAEQYEKSQKFRGFVSVGSSMVDKSDVAPETEPLWRKFKHFLELNKGESSFRWSSRSASLTIFLGARGNVIPSGPFSLGSNFFITDPMDLAEIKKCVEDLFQIELPKEVGLVQVTVGKGTQSFELKLLFG